MQRSTKESNAIRRKVVFRANCNKEEDDLENTKEKKMDFKNLVKSEWLRVVITSIILIVGSYLVSYLLSLRMHYTQRTPNDSTIEIISFILIGILIVAILNKPKTMIKSIHTGIIIGILSGGIFLFSISIYVGFGGLFITLTMFYTLFWILSGISGMLLSYFIRKAIAKRRSN